MLRKNCILQINLLDKLVVSMLMILTHMVNILLSSKFCFIICKEINQMMVNYFNQVNSFKWKILQSSHFTRKILCDSKGGKLRNNNKTENIYSRQCVCKNNVCEFLKHFVVEISNNEYLFSRKQFQSSIEKKYLMLDEKKSKLSKIRLLFYPYS